MRFACRGKSEWRLGVADEKAIFERRDESGRLMIESLAERRELGL